MNDLEKPHFELLRAVDIAAKLLIIPRGQVRLYGMQLMIQNCAVRRYPDL